MNPAVNEGDELLMIGLENRFEIYNKAHYTNKGNDTCELSAPN
mgnify:CR=1 FL=1